MPSVVLGNSSGTIKAIYQSSKFLSSTSELAPGTFGILLDKTNFYAESGGQENDTGSLTIDGKADFEVTNVQVFNGYVLHIGHLKEGELKVGDEVICTYSEVRQITTSISHILKLSLLGETMAFEKQSHRHTHPQLCST